MDLFFTSLRIQKFPGIADGGFELGDLGSGVNVIYGRNGIGKSVTSRALVAALWPGKSTADARIRAVVTDRLNRYGDPPPPEWRLTLNGLSLTTTKNGVVVDALVDLPPEIADRYHLSLHELIQADDKELAKIIAREAAGGYDVEKAKLTLGYTVGLGSPKNLTDNYKTAKAAFDTHSNEQRNWAVEEESLDRLRAELKATRSKSENIIPLGKALDFLKRQEDEKAAVAELEMFPKGMAALLKSDGSTLSNLRAGAASLRAETRKRRIDLRLAQRKKSDSFLTPESRSEEHVHALREQINTLKSNEITLQNAESNTAGSRRRLEVALTEFGMGGTAAATAAAAASTAPFYVIDDLDALATYARNAEKVRADREVIESFRHSFEAKDDRLAAGIREDRMQKGRNVLQEWLSTPPLLKPEVLAPSSDSLFPPVARNCLQIAAAALVVESVLAGPVAHPIYLVFVFAAVVLIGMSFWSRRKPIAVPPATVPDLQAIAAERYAQLLLTEFLPTAWDTAAIREMLDKLNAEIAVARVGDEKARIWEDKGPQRTQVENAESELDSAGRELAERLGVETTTLTREPGLFLVLCKKAFNVADAHAELERFVGIAAAARADESAQRGRVNNLLAVSGHPAVRDSGEATAVLEDLRTRRQNFESALAAMDSLYRSRREHTLPAIKDRRKSYREFFDRLQLAPGDEASVTQWLERLEAYKAAETAKQRAETAVRFASDQLVGVALAIQEAPQASLLTLLVEATAAETELAAKQKRITEIETRTDSARRGRTLEEATAKLEQAKDALRDDRAVKCEHHIGGLTAAYIQEDSRVDTMPVVLNAAREILATITKGQYELNFSPGPAPSFRVTDIVAGEVRELNELSSGTRVQLLLAVRIAFIEHQEQGCRLPLLLDETLANSDSERMTAVIEAVLEFVKKGRQVFYFTARQDEVRHWCDAATKGDVPCKVTDMGERRFRTPAWSETTDGLPLSVPRVVPVPDGRTAREYGAAIGVAALDPTRMRESVPLFYSLLHDLEGLHGLLNAGFQTVGQWNTLNAATKGRFTFSAGTPRDVDDWSDVVDAFREGWNIGRGKPLTREILDGSDACGNFIAKFWEITKEGNFDAKCLMSAIASKTDERVLRFQKNKSDQLRDHLLASGCLSDDEPLDLSGLRAHVLNGTTSNALPIDAVSHRVDALFEFCGGAAT